MNLMGPQGQHGQSLAPGPPRGEQKNTAIAAAYQVHAAQQGGAQIAVQPGGTAAGLAQAAAGMGVQGPAISQEYSGISTALERLASTNHNGCGFLKKSPLAAVQVVDGEAIKLATWKLEAMTFPGLQFYAHATR
jgi:hypothetical protein